MDRKEMDRKEYIKEIMNNLNNGVDDINEIVVVYIGDDGRYNVKASCNNGPKIVGLLDYVKYRINKEISESD